MNSNQVNKKRSKSPTFGIRSLWIFLVVSAVAFVGVWYYRPTVVISLPPERIELLRNIISAVVGPGILIFLCTIWKGKSDD